MHYGPSVASFLNLNLSGNNCLQIDFCILENVHNILNPGNKWSSLAVNNVIVHMIKWAQLMIIVSPHHPVFVWVLFHINNMLILTVTCISSVITHWLCLHTIPSQQLASLVLITITHIMCSCLQSLRFIWHLKGSVFWIWHNLDVVTYTLLSFLKKSAKESSHCNYLLSHPGRR